MYFPSSPQLKSLDISARRILILGILAGHIDVLSFPQLGGLFASAMTGNTTHLSFALIVKHSFYIPALLKVIGSFVCTAFIASLLRLRFGEKIGLILMTLLLVFAQFVIFFPQYRSAELFILPSLMAMQGETISRFSGNPVQTIVITNNILKCLNALATTIYHKLWDSQIPLPKSGAIILPALSWLGYINGAVIGACALVWHGPLPFLWPLPWLILLYLDVSRYGQN